jgi:hypothetical protein
VKQLVWISAVLCLASAAVKADAPVPFHASVDTEVATVGGCGATCVVLSISGTGTATHLGRLEMNGPSQINFATGQQTGTSTLTSADGSSITLTFAGAFVPTGPADASFQGTWTATGGTGRLAGVSGGGTYSGSASGDFGNLTLEGTISSPGKKP